MAYNGDERRKHNWLPLVGYVILTIVIVLAITRVQDNSIKREHLASLAACERVQLLRDQANGTNFLIYSVFSSAYDRESKLAESDNKNAKQHAKSAKAIKKTVETTIVTGSTDCLAAVDHPETYQAPVPAFIDEGGLVVRDARIRAQKITKKAITKSPLYEPGDLRGH